MQTPWDFMMILLYFRYLLFQNERQKYILTGKTYRHIVSGLLLYYVAYISDDNIAYIYIYMHIWYTSFCKSMCTHIASWQRTEVKR